MRLADNALATPPSGIREIVHRALALEGVTRLEVGESTLDTPLHIVEAAARDAHLGFTRYTASAGMPDLREAICGKLARVNGIAATPDQVVVSAGGVQALFLTLAALCDPGDEVLVPGPAWPNYGMICTLLGARCRAYPCEAATGFQPNIDEIEALVGARTRVIVVNSPNNPTGAVVPADTVHRLVALAERTRTALVSDEAYDELYFGAQPVSPASLGVVDDAPVVSVFSFSKTYAMTGWRAGYAVAPRPLANVLAKLQEPTISCVTSVSQRAALAAISGPQDFVVQQRAMLGRRRDAITTVLAERGEFTYRAEGGFYVLLDVTPLASRDFALALLDREGIAVAPGSAFGPGGEGFVRICFAAGGDGIEDAVRRIVDLRRERVGSSDAPSSRAAAPAVAMADQEEAV